MQSALGICGLPTRCCKHACTGDPAGPVRFAAWGGGPACKGGTCWRRRVGAVPGRAPPRWHRGGVGLFFLSDWEGRVVAPFPEDEEPKTGVAGRGTWPLQGWACDSSVRPTVRDTALELKGQLNWRLSTWVELNPRTEVGCQEESPGGDGGWRAGGGHAQRQVGGDRVRALLRAQGDGGVWGGSPRPAQGWAGHWD